MVVLLLLLVTMSMVDYSINIIIIIVISWTRETEIPQVIKMQIHTIWPDRTDDILFEYYNSGRLYVSETQSERDSWPNPSPLNNLPHPSVAEDFIRLLIRSRASFAQNRLTVTFIS